MSFIQNFTRFNRARFFNHVFSQAGSGQRLRKKQPRLSVFLHVDEEKFRSDRFRLLNSIVATSYIRISYVNKIKEWRCRNFASRALLLHYRALERRTVITTSAIDGSVNLLLFFNNAEVGLDGAEDFARAPLCARYTNRVPRELRRRLFFFFRAQKQLPGRIATTNDVPRAETRGEQLH